MTSSCVFPTPNTFVMIVLSSAKWVVDIGEGVLSQKIFGLNGAKSCNFFYQNNNLNALS